MQGLQPAGQPHHALHLCAPDSSPSQATHLQCNDAHASPCPELQDLLIHLPQAGSVQVTLQTHWHPFRPLPFQHPGDCRVAAPHPDARMQVKALRLQDHVLGRHHTVLLVLHKCKQSEKTARGFPFKLARVIAAKRAPPQRGWHCQRRRSGSCAAALGCCRHAGQSSAAQRRDSMRGADPQGQHRHAAGAFVSQCNVVQGKCEADPNGRAQDRCRAHRQSTGRERGWVSEAEHRKEAGTRGRPQNKGRPQKQSTGSGKGQTPEAEHRTAADLTT